MKYLIGLIKEMIEIPLEIHEMFEARRLGISFLKLMDFSVGRDLEHAINAIQSEIDKTPLGVHRRIVQQFEHLKKERELHLSAIVEVPIKIKELVVDKKEVGIKERIEYYTRNIKAIIKLKENYIVFFAQSQNEVKELANYLRELTTMKFNPVRIKLAAENMRKVVQDFETLQQLKVNMKQPEIKFVRFSGNDLFGSPIVREILSNEENEIIEIAGIKTLSPGDKVKIHLNNNGRLWIYANPDKIGVGDIYNLVKDFEKTFLEGKNYTVGTAKE